MEIVLEQLNTHACKTYLLGLKKRAEVVLIDPVIDQIHDYIKLLEERKARLLMVIDTHTHADHISGAAALKDITGCEYLMHKAAPAHCAGFRVIDNTKIKLFDRIPVSFLHTPGHTQDSICLVLPDIIFTGDTLFLDEGGAGRDDLPGGDPAAHWQSLQRILSLPQHLVVYPAHEYRNRQPSSLKRQKKVNPHLAKKNKKEYIDYLESMKLGPADWMEDVLEANYVCARNPRAAWIPVDSPACEIKGTLEPGVNDIQVELVDVPQLKTLVTAGTSEPPVLIDVREADELVLEPATGLRAAINIPITDLTKRLPELEAYKDKDIITICKMGGRAYTAAQILTKAGFSRVKVLEGGIQAWRQN